VKALLRLALLYNIPTASNRATADFLISSPFMSSSYERIVPDYLGILKRIAEDNED
jgi:methylglyoxal synthase